MALDVADETAPLWGGAVSKDSLGEWVIYGIRLKQVGSPYRYIGLTTNGIHWRFRHDHLRRAFKDNVRSPLCNWLRNHPRETCIEVIEVCPQGDLEFLGERERYWISYHRDLNGSVQDYHRPDRLLNVADGGIGSVGSGTLHWNQGKNRPEEVRNKISSTRKSRNIVPWNKGLTLPEMAGEGNPYFGRTHSEEVREKMSQSSHKRWHSSRGVVKESCKWCLRVDEPSA